MKVMMNWYDALLMVADDNPNHDLKNWVKIVYQVETDIPNGYMYIGDFINKGTAEIEIEPSVFIVMTSSGTEEDFKQIYRIIVMDADGLLHRSEMWTDGDTPGWALRLRDSVIELLIEMEILGMIERAQYDYILPVETIDLLEKEALRALDKGDDVPVYPETLLALLHHYRERMKL